MLKNNTTKKLKHNLNDIKTDGTNKLLLTSWKSGKHSKKIEIQLSWVAEIDSTLREKNIWVYLIIL